MRAGEGAPVEPSGTAAARAGTPVASAPWWRAYDDVVGMNARNAHIARANSRESIRLVDDKAATKDALTAHGVPVAPTLALVQDGRWVRRLSPDSLPEEWVVKPNRGLGGNGIMIAVSRDGDGWRSPSGRRLRLLDVKDHLRFVLDGEFSGRARDAALVEPRLVADPAFARLSHQGLPDVRVICSGDRPQLAMARLPTAESGGRANLHQRAVGAAVDLASGRIVAARIGKREVTHHPDTGEPLTGATLPCWAEVVEASRRCSAATGLHYVGADVVVDRDRGPLVLEVNARPGLQIQNVASRGIRDVLQLPSQRRAPEQEQAQEQER